LACGAPTSGSASNGREGDGVHGDPISVYTYWQVRRGEESTERKRNQGDEKPYQVEISLMGICLILDLARLGCMLILEMYSIRMIRQSSLNP
jgi:hypothetical protein